MNQQIHERILKGAHTHGEKQAYTVLPIHEATGFSAVLKMHETNYNFPLISIYHENGNHRQHQETTR